MTTSDKMDAFQAMPKEVLCIGLNPAFQTTLHFEHFNKGGVNRSFKKTHSIGGKGQNFAMACEQYAQHERVTLLQFVGGMTGNFITQVLDEKHIHQINVTTRKATRTCTTVLDQSVNDMTELIEPTGLICRTERESLENLAETLIGNGRDHLRAIALCGTYPTGITGSTYARIAKAKSPHMTLLLDAYKDVGSVLATGQVDIFKINKEELAVLVQEIDRAEAKTHPSSLRPASSLSLSSSNGAHPPNFTPSKLSSLAASAASPTLSDRYSDMSTPELAKKLLQTYQIGLLGVTNGPDSAYLFKSADHYHVFDLPSLSEVMKSMRANHCLLPDYSDTASLPSSLPSPVALDEMNEDMLRLRLFPSSHSGHTSYIMGGGGVVSNSSNHLMVSANDHNNGHGDTSSAATSSSSSVTGGNSSFIDNMQKLCHRKEETTELLLNPLGAGDTASAVFLMDYIDTRDPVESFKRGIAAASASCFVTEQTAHFDVSIMEWISDRIQVREVKISSSSQLKQASDKATTTTTILETSTMAMPVPVVKP
ncbi:hypothetical protein BDF19DRAFT_438196 [Syncephalis fuscata]|nr:hypothetical protein BDF19DRAFT_438196 [Syncephalis fuscata]